MFQNAKGESTVLEAVRSFLPEIEAASDESEQNRGLNRHLTERLRDAGLFRMLIPKNLGGEGLDLFQTLRVVETLAQADASAGWMGMVTAGFHVLLPLFPKETVDEVLRGRGDVMIRGAIAPKGKITQVDGGYRISGQWPLASGSYPYDWVMANGILFDEDGPRRVAGGGMPEMVMVLLPAHEAKFLDSWDSVGLRGSASHDFVLDNIFVPRARSTSLFAKSSIDSPIYRLPFRILTGTQHTAVSTGAAIGALDDLARLAATKRPAFRPNVRLIEDPVFRQRFGELSAKLDALRCCAYWHAEEYMELAHSDRMATPADEARHSAMVTYVSEACVEIINQAFVLAGASACYRSNKIQRRWRDARVTAQHAAASPDNYQFLGGELLPAEADPDQKRKANVI